MRWFIYSMLTLGAVMAVSTAAAQQRGAGTARFEVTSLRGVRPVLVRLISALE
jgi:hypothetical protein